MNEFREIVSLFTLSFDYFELMITIMTSNIRKREGTIAKSLYLFTT